MPMVFISNNWAKMLTKTFIYCIFCIFEELSHADPDLTKAAHSFSG